jgi:hypothetical protein
MMYLNIDDPRLNDPRRPKPAPAQYAGQWVAWNKDGTAIIAHGSDVALVREAAIAAGCSLALLQKVHRPDRMQIGLS